MWYFFLLLLVKVKTFSTADECEQRQISSPYLTIPHTHSFNGQLSMCWCVYRVFLLFLGALILSTSYTNVCSAPWKQHSSNNVWSITIYTLCSLLILYSFDLMCQEKVDSFFLSARNSVCLRLQCALYLEFCLLPVQCNVIHQYTSTQPHPVKDHLNVNIIQVLFEEKLPTVCLSISSHDVQFRKCFWHQTGLCSQLCWLTVSFK